MSSQRLHQLIVIPMLALCLQPAAASAKAPVTLQPVTPWNVNWSRTTCTLARGFVDAKMPDVLSIERFAPTDDFQMVLTSDQFQSFAQGQRLTIRYGSLPAVTVKSALPGKTVKRRAMLFVTSTSLIGHDDNAVDSGPSRVTPQQEALANKITMEFGGKSVTFNTGPLDKAFAALRTCTSDLVKSWGLDPEQQASLTRHATPSGDPGHWLNSGDYPQAMLRAGKQAIVNFRLNVDEQGKPAACEIQRSFADKEFDNVTCSILMRRARFDPALDKSSHPVPSYYINTVRWIM